MSTPETTPAPITEQHPLAARSIRVADQAYDLATMYVIDSPDMYEAAGADLRDIATKAKEIEETRLSLTRPLDESKRRIMDLFRGPLDRLNQAQEVLRKSMLVWKQAEDARIAREREEAERAAEAERVRLEQERAAAEAAEREARARADAALAQGDTDAAMAAIAAAEEANATAAEAAERAELAEIAPTIAMPAATPKAAGISTRQTWKAEVVDFAALVKAAGERPELLAYLQPNDSAIAGVAKALKGETRIPGVRVYAEESLAVRRK